MSFVLENGILVPQNSHDRGPSASATGMRSPGANLTLYDGEKYDGGLGAIDFAVTDYYALRQRSASFFKKNPYARGIIRRIETNVINTGLVLEANPTAKILGRDPDALAAWAEDVDNLFEAWGSLADVCHTGKQYTFGEYQRVAYRESLISGDVLIVDRFNRKTGLPSFEIIDATVITTPLGSAAMDNNIIDGVEVNDAGEHVAFWVIQKDFKHKRIPARGRNNRLLAWMFYATDKRHSETRGEPLLSLVMQAVNDIDNYRDSAQRKAYVGSLMAIFFSHDPVGNTPGTAPISSGAVRRSVTPPGATTGGHDLVATTPGMVFEELPPGIQPKMFNADTTDEKFGEFEEAVLHGVAWCLGIPVSVLTMKFGSSYSASRGEVKEYNTELVKTRGRIADTMLKPIYRSWLRDAVLSGHVSAPGFLDAARNMRSFATYAAWTASNWWGVVKEAVDLPKEVSGLSAMADRGYTTNSAAARQMTGTSFWANIPKVARENAAIAEAMRPVLLLQQEFGPELVEQMRAEMKTRQIEANNATID